MQATAAASQKNPTTIATRREKENAPDACEGPELSACLSIGWRIPVLDFEELLVSGLK
jgi:hypothetical protein